MKHTRQQLSDGAPARIACLVALVTLVTPFTMHGVAAAPREKTSARPSFVLYQLAGGDLLKEQSYVLHDPKSRYYLIASGDCDGASVDLILTPSPSAEGQSENDRDFAKDRNAKQKTLPRLRSGNGVNIGDTPEQVKRKLGASPQQVNVAGEPETIEWTYYAHLPIKRAYHSGPQNYRANYKFRKGRLWSIGYHAATEQGCG